MTISTSAKATVSPWRDRVASVLMIAAAAAAAVSFFAAIDKVTGAGGATRVVETWRMIGFFVFAGLFALLAWRPRLYAGVWELALVNTAALAIVGLVYGGSYLDARAVTIIDGVLAVFIAVAYLLSKGYLAWGAARRSEPRTRLIELRGPKQRGAEPDHAGPEQPLDRAA